MGWKEAKGGASGLGALLVSGYAHVRVESVKTEFAWIDAGNVRLATGPVPITVYTAPPARRTESSWAAGAKDTARRKI